MLNSMIHLGKRVLCAIDVRTTGPCAGHHEILELAIVPLDSTLKPILTPFHTYIKPMFNERIDTEYLRFVPKGMIGISPDSFKVYDLFNQWFEQMISSYGFKQIIPLSYNYKSEFMKYWLGEHFDSDILYHYFFTKYYRDICVIAQYYTDLCYENGFPQRFADFNLQNLCNIFQVKTTRTDNALSDAYHISKIYARMMQLRVGNQLDFKTTGRKING